MASRAIDQAISEFELVVRAIFSGPRRDIEVMKSKIRERTRSRADRARLQRELELMVARELQRETNGPH